jgi:apolipoprotein N-acyltransferase
MLRATNTGVTVIIDERGHIRAVAPQHIEATLEGTAQGFTGSTPYVIWGNWPVLVICFGGVGFSFAFRWTAQRYKARASTRQVMDQRWPASKAS